MTELMFQLSIIVGLVGLAFVIMYFVKPYAYRLYGIIGGAMLAFTGLATMMYLSSPGRKSRVITGLVAQAKGYKY